MYRPIVRLNTNICKVCSKVFKSEKALKDHIFNKRICDKEHTLFKNEIREMRFKNAKLSCPVCKQKIFRQMKTHFNNNKDRPHKKFLKIQKKYFVNEYLKGNSCLDILNVKNKYTNDFSYKYTAYSIIKSIGKLKFDKTSKVIFSNRRINYWNNFSPEERKKIMKKVRDLGWSKLTPEERKKHPWVIAGRKASLKSSKRGSKNQKYAFDLLKRRFPNIDWEYNYTINDEWHVDMAAPKKCIFIEWDGRHHFVPIHGQSYLNNRINRDKIKNRIITEKIGGCLIRVKDLGRANCKFVEGKINQIAKVLNKGIQKGELIRL